MQTLRSQSSIIGLLSAFSLCFSAEPVFAQIIPDGTLGSERSVVNRINGVGDTHSEQVTQRITQGAIRGEHLFHSFEQFNIADGESAYFANPVGINTILSRVTGNDISDIFGTLGVEGNANLFFLNPNGVVFGPNAQLDIAGSFVVSTGERFTFPDGSDFSATEPNAAPLLTMNLAPGLQLGTSQSSIISDAQLMAGGDLTLHGRGLDIEGRLMAGDNLRLMAEDTVQIRDSEASPFVALAGGTLTIEGNTIDIFALNHPHSELVSRGDMTLRSVEPVIGDAHYWSGGQFQIEHQEGELGYLLSLDDPIIRSQGDVTFAHYAGASLHILSGGAVTINTITITGPDTTGNAIAPTTTPNLANVALSNGDSIIIDGTTRPTVDIRAGMVVNELGSPLGTTGVSFPRDSFFNDFFFEAAPTNTSTASSANITIGDIQIAPQDGLVLLTNQYQPNPALGGGDILITGDGLIGRGIQASGDENSPPNASVILDARQAVQLNENVAINVIGQNGGGILINAENLTLLPKSRLISGIFSRTGTPSTQGGDIVLNVRDTLQATDADINAILGQDALGQIGDILINAGTVNFTNMRMTNRLLEGAQGQSGTIQIQADRDVQLLEGTIILNTLEAGSIGTGGNITIQANNIALDGITQVNITVEGANNGFAAAQGNGGDIILSAQDTLSITGQDDRTQLRSRVISQVDTGARGNSGDIRLNARNLILANGGRVGNLMFGEGNGGNIIFDVDNAFTMNNGSVLNNLVGRGTGGNTQVTAQSLTIANGNGMSSETRGEGSTGAITIDVEDAITVDAAGIQNSVEVQGIGQAGDIEIRGRSLSLTNGGQINITTVGQGNTGQISIDTQDFVRVEGIDSDQIESGISNRVAPDATGNSGPIRINTGTFEVLNTGRINTNSQGDGNAGDIAIQASERIHLSGTGELDVFTGISSSVSAIATGNGGTVSLTTNTLDIDQGAVIITTLRGTGRAGDITIQSNGPITVDTLGSITASGSPGSEGNAGDIDIEGQSLTLTNGGRLISANFGQGNGGDIDIDVEGAFEISGLQETTIPAIPLDGLGGFDLSVLVGEVTQTVGSNLASLIGPGNGENGNNRVKGGSISISAESLTIQDLGFIGSSSFGQGDAGNISINVEDTITLNQSNIESNVAFGGRGNAGNIELQGRSLILTNGAQVSAALGRSQGNLPGGQGRGGTIRVNTSEAVDISGTYPESTISAPNVFNPSAPLLASGFPSGLVVTVEQGTAGPAGNIFVETDRFSIRDGAVVESATLNESPGGNIEIIANTFTARDGGQLLTTTLGAGKAGNIRLEITDEIVLSGVDETFDARLAAFPKEVAAIAQNRSDASGLYANTAGTSTGAGGNILVDPRLVRLTDQAQIAVNSEGTGVGGSIDLVAGTLLLSEQSSISAETASNTGGNIALSVTDLLVLQDESDISTTAGTKDAGGDGGNIDIAAGFIVALPNEDSDIQANAFRGNGGNIQISAQDLFGIEFRPQETDLSDITATSELGLDGEITIATLGIDPVQSVAELPVETAPPPLSQGCAPGGGRGNFTNAGQGGIPLRPGDVRGSDRAWEDITPPEALSEIAEAQHWRINNQGQLVLAAELDREFAQLSCH